MDKFAILRKVQQAASSLPDTAQTTFAIRTLCDLEMRLQADVKADVNRQTCMVCGLSSPLAERSVESVAAVRDVWCAAAAAKRRKVTCKRLRDERDAAREYITRMDQERKDLIAERDALVLARNKAHAGYDVLQGIIDRMREDHDEVRDERDKLRDECNALQAAYSASQAELADAKQALEWTIGREKGLKADLLKCQAERADALMRIVGVTRLNIRLNEDLQQVCDENASLRAKLDAAPDPCPVSDRLAALEDHVELMGAQFAAYCKTVNEQFCDVSDSITHGFQIVHKRLDTLRNV